MKYLCISPTKMWKKNLYIQSWRHFRTREGSSPSSISHSHHHQVMVFPLIEPAFRHPLWHVSRLMDKIIFSFELESWNGENIYDVFKFHWRFYGPSSGEVNRCSLVLYKILLQFWCFLNFQFLLQKLNMILDFICFLTFTQFQ